MAEEGERNWGAVRSEHLSELFYWRNRLKDSNKRFLEPNGPRPPTILNQDFIDSQIAHGKVNTLVAQLESFDRLHGFENFPI